MGASTYIIGAVVGTVVIVMVCLIAANSLVRSLVLNTKVINGQNKAKQELTTKLDNAPKLISAYNQLGPERSVIEDALPTDADFPELVTIAESMAASSGVDLKSVAPAAAASVSATSTAPTTTPAATTGTTSTASSAVTPSQYQFTLSVTGGYSQIVSFLGAIESSARPMQVSSTQLSGTGGLLTANLDINTYYQGAATVTDKTEVVK
jgi:Tfp pilus assembly protein PilO